MKDNFLYTIVTVARNPALLFWPMAFPIIMALLFSFMFADMDKGYALQPASIGVVIDEAYDAAQGLDETLRSVDGSSDSPQDVSDSAHIMDLCFFDSAQEGQDAVRAGEIDGCVVVKDGIPTLLLPPSGLSEEARLHLTAVTAVLDGYVRVAHETQTVIEAEPSRLFAHGTDYAQAISDISGSFLSDTIQTTRLRLTKADPDPSVRYYYALLGMAAGLGMTIAFEVTRSLSARAGALGARRTLAAHRRWQMLTSSLAAAWLMAFFCLVIGLAFMRFAIHVDFGDRLVPCLAALATSSALFCAAGTLMGTFDGVPASLITAVTMLLSFFAGLFGTASQRIADGIAAYLPWLAALNPVRQTAQLFYSLLYYESLTPYVKVMATMLVMTAAFVALAALRARRIQHAHL